ncbi:hypothetical protein BASA60_007849 [Batrachochytrium salamandrivorans]|nr:hypothetical protein BASA60_007849 [Batrachochytrium salamandrivorans]
MSTATGSIPRSNGMEFPRETTSSHSTALSSIQRTVPRTSDYAAAAAEPSTAENVSARDIGNATQYTTYLPNTHETYEPTATTSSSEALESRKTNPISNTNGQSTIFSQTTLRNCSIMKLYFMDHYFDLLTYLDNRNQRLAEFKKHVSESRLPEEEVAREWTTYNGRERAYLRKRRTRMRISHFQIVKQVGQGGYGQVFLAKKKDTSELCALKRMNKKLLMRMGEIQHILTERDILARTDSPWLVNLLYAFQDMDNVYLAMEFVPGGDFRTLLNASGVLRHDCARIYFAEMCASVFALHNFGYIHRDLKPENFLIDATGHIKLTDFGLSRAERLQNAPLTLKSVNDRFNTHRSMRKELRAFTLVGSPDYMAPEVLSSHQQGYDLSVDYWSLGCILFECLAGYPPFTANSTDEVWLNVYHWSKVLERPVYVGQDEEFNLSDCAWNLITKLIASHENRFKTPEEVEHHPFLDKHITFSSLRTADGPTPPLVPKLASNIDTSYFDDFNDPNDMERYKEVHQRQADLDKSNSEHDDGDSTRNLRSAFVGFTFKHNQVIPTQLQTLV